ncbi:MAG: transporter substrate-binding domain-containing protein [Lachnospiraceae bacterium]|nr:transporter substrate-binding domain-containing protein [Lachnospiraceae bacterium]
MKKLLVMSMIACMAFSAVACGAKEEAPADGAEAPAETETPEDAADEAAPAEASGDKTWIIAMDTVFRPFEFTDETGEFVGIDVDVMKAVAEDQGFNYEIQSLGWDAAVAAVQAGQADGLIAGASITDERKASGWIFSDGYYNATQTFVLPEGTDLSEYDDPYEYLRGKNVAVKNGTAGADFAASLAEEYGFDCQPFEDSPTMYQAVIIGNYAACVEDTPIMADSIKTGGLALEIPEGMESDGAPYGFAIMNEANQELLDMFNAGLANIRENGTYDEIIAKYLGE